MIRILRNNNVDAVNERKRVASTSTLLNVYNHMWGRKNVMRSVQSASNSLVVC